MANTILSRLSRAPLKILIFMCSYAFGIGLVNATTIERVDMEFLLENSVLVFEGEVLEQQSAWNAEHTSIFTAVLFRINDVIKGDYSQEFITLNYAGGVVGDQGMRVSAMVYPDVGERGIYFIENTDQKLINPMAGWGQGHYVIQVDGSGEERLLTETRHPILEVDTERVSTGPQARQSNSATVPFSEGVALGLKTGDANSDLSAAMKKQAFKKIIREKLRRMNSVEGR